MKMYDEGHVKRKRCSGGGMRPLCSVQEEAIAQRILHPRVLRKDISERGNHGSNVSCERWVGCSFHEALGICHTAKLQ